MCAKLKSKNHKNLNLEWGLTLQTKASTNIGTQPTPSDSQVWASVGWLLNFDLVINSDLPTGLLLFFKL
jgi:hypothetical protein